MASEPSHERRARHQQPADPGAADAAYDATWSIYDSAVASCRDVHAAFEDALATLRSTGKCDNSPPMAAAARAAVDVLHALDMAELIRRRAAYDAIVATVGAGAAPDDRET